MKKKIVLLLLMAAVPAALSACGKDNGTPETTAPPELERISVELGDYKNFSYNPTEVAETTDEDVENEISYELSQDTESTQVTDRAVAEGDTISLTYTRTIEGEEPVSEEGIQFHVGEGYFDDDFEKQLLGAEPGKELSFAYILPDSEFYGDDAGKEAACTATVNYILEKGETPVFDDVWVKENTDCETTDSYRAEVKARIQSMNDYEAKYADMNGLIEQLVDSSTVSIPDSAIEDQVQTELENYKTEASGASMSLEEYAKEYYQYDSLDDLTEGIREYLKEDLKRDYVEDAFIETENLSLTDEGKQEFRSNQAALYGYKDSNAMKEELENFGIADALDDTYKEEVIGERLLKYAKAE